jgi:hypothetical protein
MKILQNEITGIQTIIWTQIVFRYHKVKTIRAKGKLRKKNHNNTFTISGPFNMFQVKAGPKTG